MWFSFIPAIPLSLHGVRMKKVKDTIRFFRNGLLFRFLPSVTYVLSSCISSASAPQTIVVEAETITDIDGTAHFYWDKKVTSLEDVASFSGQTGSVTFPAFWSVSDNGFLETHPKGLATFHLKLQLPDTTTQYAIKILSMVSAYEIWADGDRLTNVGKVGRQEETMRPDFQPQLITLPRKSELDLFFIVSNFHHRKGGGSWEAIKIGPEEAMSSASRLNFSFELFAASMMVFIFMYHLLMYAFYPTQKAYLFFALAVLLSAFRIATTGEMVLEVLVSGFPYWLNQGLRYACYALPTGFLVLFISYFLEIERKWLSFIFFYITLLFSLLALTLPTYSATQLTPIYHALTSANLIMCFYLILKSRKKFPVETAFMLAISSIMLLILVHAILVSFEFIGGYFFYEEGFLLLMIVQVIILAYRHKEVHLERTTLQSNLRYKEGDLATVISDNRMRKKFRENLLEEIEQVRKSDPEVIRTKLNSLTHALRIQNETEEKLTFAQEHILSLNAEFDKKLRDRYPDLNANERELCQLIRLNLSVKEMARIRNTSEGATKTARHRIKNKLGLDSLEDLDDLFVGGPQEL